MPEATHHPDGQPEHASVRYERSDASFRWVLGLVIGAMVFAAVVHYVLLVFFEDYRAHLETVRRSPFPLAPAPSRALPAEPRLEQLDRLEGVVRPDVYERQAAREKVLAGYGPTGEAGYVHVPIDQAIDHLAGKLHVRATPAAAERRRERGLLDAGEPNSGQPPSRRRS